MGAKEKKADAKKVARQQAATLAVLACFQKLSDVSLDNYETVKAEFDKVMETELPDIGAQQEVLKAEANRVFGYAKQYIEQIKGQQSSAEDAKQKKAEEKARKDEEKRKKAKEEEEEKIKHKKEKEEERRRRDKEKEEERRRRDEKARKDEEKRKKA